uniref:LRRCT domain-containing protein n=1 Tax=Panagrellus redivivus TaxID=6233 RepID=A0A7E4W994_PANRE
MISFFLFVFVLTLQQAIALPNGCVTDASSLSSENDPIDYVKCSGSNFTEVMEFYRDQNILELIIENCNPVIPRLTKLPNITVSTLAILKCSIEEVDDDTFENVHNLTTLILAQNAITTFISLDHLPVINELHLSRNKINHIPNGTFQRNSVAGNKTDLNFKFLDLSYNNLTEITNDNFVGLTSVEALHLQYNQIGDIGTDAFRGVNIIGLNLGGNKLTRLTAGTFSSLPNLGALAVHENHLHELENGTFAPMRNLSALLLDKNDLEQLSSQMFDGLESLFYLDLSYNKLSNLDHDVLHKMPKLMNLSLAHNQLSNLSPSLLSKSEGLFKLYLQNNKIETLPKGFISNSPMLREIYLSNNTLRELNSDAFVDCRLLRFFDLRYNNLTTVPEDFVGINPLQGVFKLLLPTFGDYFLLLEGNPIVCDDKLKWLGDAMKDNSVRVNRICATTFPKCVAPFKHVGKSLKDAYVTVAEQITYDEITNSFV